MENLRIILKEAKNMRLISLNEPDSALLRDYFEINPNSQSEIMEEFRYSQINQMETFIWLQRIQNSYINKSQQVILVKLQYYFYIFCSL